MTNSLDPMELLKAIAQALGMQKRKIRGIVIQIHVENTATITVEELVSGPEIDSLLAVLTNYELRPKRVAETGELTTNETANSTQTKGPADE